MSTPRHPASVLNLLQGAHTELISPAFGDHHPVSTRDSIKPGKCLVSFTLNLVILSTMKTKQTFHIDKNQQIKTVVTNDGDIPPPTYYTIAPLTSAGPDSQINHTLCLISMALSQSSF
ncbi:MAG: hypothetical protein A07HR60_02304 [uncultured archaeon A07HR60]|nr:MAG: hypothetical protein A07HR60_02304 [uncultured archaeon A07HR60]